MWRLLTRRFGHDGYEPTREAATAAFAKSWRREVTGHVGFWGAPEMRLTGEPIQRVLCPERSSGAFIGLAYRP
jgi:hypothetical protein